MSLDMKSSLEVACLFIPHSSREHVSDRANICKFNIFSFNNASNKCNSETDFCRDKVHSVSLAQPRNLWNAGL